MVALTGLAYNRTAYTNTLLTGSPYSYMFGPDNQNSSGGFTYDGSGNPTQYNGSGTSAYAYDPEQRLTGLGGFSAHYDGDGLRDYTIASGTTTYFVYDGSSPVLEETYSGTTTTIQVANGMADGWRERYAATSFGFNAYGFDPQGNLSVEDSSFDTTLPAQNVYVFDGYGNRLVGERVSNGSTTAFNVDPVQFGGQYGYYTDTSTGEVDLTHRYYDTATGHFLNRDPIGYAGGQNLYAFCGNNPITGSDPNGTDDYGFSTGWAGFSTAIWNFPGLKQANDKYHIYDAGAEKSAPGFKASVAFGTIGRDALVAAATTKLAAPPVANVIPFPGGKGMSFLGWWNSGIETNVPLNKMFLYEIGQKTMSDANYQNYASIADPAEKGAAIIKNEGLFSAIFKLDKGFADPNRQLPTGPTPAARAGLRNLGFFAWAFSEYLNNKDVINAGLKDIASSSR